MGRWGTKDGSNRPLRRRVVGWAMAHPLRTVRVLAALNRALGQRRPEGVVHHSGKDSPYISLALGKGRQGEMSEPTSTGSPATASKAP